MNFKYVAVVSILLAAVAAFVVLDKNPAQRGTEVCTTPLEFDPPIAAKWGGGVGPKWCVGFGVTQFTTSKDIPLLKGGYADRPGLICNDFVSPSRMPLVFMHSDGSTTRVDVEPDTCIAIRVANMNYNSSCSNIGGPCPLISHRERSKCPSGDKWVSKTFAHRYSFTSKYFDKKSSVNAIYVTNTLKKGTNWATIMVSEINGTQEICAPEGVKIRVSQYTDGSSPKVINGGNCVAPTGKNIALSAPDIAGATADVRTRMLRYEDTDLFGSSCPITVPTI